MPSEAITHAIEAIREMEVNFVALDFDQTLIKVHTYGRYTGKAEELAIDVRPVFREFVPAVLDSGIHIAIVTFSGQVGLIRRVLEIVFGKDRASMIVIRGREDSWRAGQLDQGGKQSYMASAASEISNHYSVEITRHSTLLIDDDRNNVKTALQAGVRALVFKPEKPDSILDDIMELRAFQLRK